MEDLVSAVIVTHNRLELLKKSVESVINQTYGNIELIVVDDASADGTKEWMNSIISNKIKYIRIEKENSKGGNYARNVGIKHANGEFIALLDDDDIWYPTKIELQMSCMNLSDKVGLVYCGHRKILDNNRSVDFLPNPAFQGDLSRDVFASIFCTTSMMLIKREIFENVGYFDLHLKYWQEYDLLIRICQKYEISYVDKILVDILALSSDSVRLSNRLEGWMEAVNYIETKYSKDISALPKAVERERKYMIYNDGANRCYCVNDKKKHREFLLKAFAAKPSVKAFIKLVFNLSNVDITQIKGVLKAD